MQPNAGRHSFHSRRTLLSPPGPVAPDSRKWPRPADRAVPESVDRDGDVHAETVVDLDVGGGAAATPKSWRASTITRPVTTLQKTVGPEHLVEYVPDDWLLALVVVTNGSAGRVRGLG